MLSTTAEYALRAIVHLATHPRRRSPAHEIARHIRVPPLYLAKILQSLARAGLVRARRGPGGGFSLTRSPQAISILDVVNAVDPLHRIRTCPLGIPSHGQKLCRLHQYLDDTIAKVERAFRQASIAEMCEPSPAGSRCLFPTVSARRRPGPGRDLTARQRGAERLRPAG